MKEYISIPLKYHRYHIGQSRPIDMDLRIVSNYKSPKFLYFYRGRKNTDVEITQVYPETESVDFGEIAGFTGILTKDDACKENIIKKEVQEDAVVEEKRPRLDIFEKEEPVEEANSLSEVEQIINRDGYYNEVYPSDYADEVVKKKKQEAWKYLLVAGVLIFGIVMLSIGFKGFF